ncbi:YolD-like family protein [Paenibacillus sp. GYB003]|uniref:YolD-like family protein n=1 Tax=Paenibacillus sp. GYB003 TaxID=2994392 RepID=UPI002F96E4E3
MGKKLEGNGLFESSRMMLPEHVRRIVEHTEAEKKGGPRKRPEIDESELEDMSRKLQESKAEGRDITLTLWGRDEPVTGVVSRIDTYFKRITLTQFWGDTVVVRLDDIIDVK